MPNPFLVFIPYIEMTCSACHGMIYTKDLHAWFCRLYKEALPRLGYWSWGDSPGRWIKKPWSCFWQSSFLDLEGSKSHYMCALPERKQTFKNSWLVVGSFPTFIWNYSSDGAAAASLNSLDLCDAICMAACAGCSLTPQKKPISKQFSPKYM